MMRSPASLVVAVRRPDGRIAVREQAWEPLLPGTRLLKVPFVRGAVVLVESLLNGFTALSFSADQAEPSEDGGKPPSRGERGLSPGASFVFMVGLFIAAPHLLTLGLFKLLGHPVGMKSLAFHLVDGVFRIGILVGWLALIARTAEAKRLFAYHGAEHKAIWTYETRLPLTVENARRFTTEHPRADLLPFVVVGVAVLLHAAPAGRRWSQIGAVQTVFLLGVKILLAFPVAAIAYELQSARHGRTAPAPQGTGGTGALAPADHHPRALGRPAEIALLALERALAREEGRPRTSGGVQVYPNFQGALAA
jgi:uncharacterized protein YqhQ